MPLDIKDLTFSYPKTDEPVLKSLSVSFPKGRITAVTGLNGCGKSTLVRSITGLLRPSSGRITIDGMDTSTMSIAEIASFAGCVLQNPSCQIFELTVEDEMAYGLKNRGIEGQALEDKITHFLDYFELLHHRHEFPGTLSKGEKQRLVLAEILAMEPRYVLLDEPTSSLDMGRRKLLGTYLRKICADGVGVVIVTHDHPFAEYYADEIKKMEKGKFIV